MAKDPSAKQGGPRDRVSPPVKEIEIPGGLPRPPAGLEQAPRVELEGEVYLSPAALVARWGHTVRMKTLKNRRSLGQGPRFVRINRQVYYPLEGVRRHEREVMKIRVPDDGPSPASSGAARA